MNEFAARLLTREAVIDNRRVKQPEPEDFEITALLIELAQQIDPDEIAIARAGVEARLAAEDHRGAIEHTRTIVRLDPSDTVAQLRLISHIINEKQTAAERLALVDRFLEDGSRTIAAEVRSRLALDAALWSRDAGDNDEFVRYLSEATRLDPTNKDAAFLAATYYASHRDDPIGRLDLLANLLYADPIDPNTQLTIARTLAEEGAFVQAKRFHDNALIILRQSGVDIGGGRVELEHLLLTWLVDGAQATVDLLNDRLVRQRDQLAREIRAAEAAGQPVPTGLAVGTHDLSFGLERIRLVAATAAGDLATANSASVAIERLIERSSEAQRIGGTPEEEVKANEDAYRTDLYLTRLWTGIEVEKTLEVLPEFLANLGDDADSFRVRLLEVFRALRTDDPARAREMLEGIEEEAPIRELGRALVLTAEGDDAGAREALASLAWSPLTPPGAWAITVLEREGTELPFARRSAEAESLARAIPPWLDRVIVDPDSFMKLTVEPLQGISSPVERYGLRVRLVNTSPMPLAVGPNSALNSKMLFIPRMDVNVERFPGVFGPQVVPMDRRLRLAPREELVVDVWPSFWPQSFYLDAFAARTVRTRWRLVQGFTFVRETGYQPGPLCLATDSSIVTKKPLAEASVAYEELARRVRQDPEETLISVLTAIRAHWNAVSPTLAPMSEEQKAAIAAAAAERYPKLGDHARIAMLLKLSSANLWPAMAPLDEVALQDKDPDVLPIVLLTRADEPDHPTFDWASRTGNAKVERLSTLLKRRLERGGYAHSRMGLEQGNQGVPGVQGGG
jgi:tetratricopeptide (TPR) repeat protein